MTSMTCSVPEMVFRRGIDFWQYINILLITSVAHETHSCTSFLLLVRVFGRPRAPGPSFTLVNCITVLSVAKVLREWEKKEKQKVCICVCVCEAFTASWEISHSSHFMDCRPSKPLCFVKHIFIVVKSHGPTLNWKYKIICNCEIMTIIYSLDSLSLKPWTPI